VSKGLEKAKRIETQVIQSQEQGEITLQWKANQEGAYRIKAQATLDGSTLETHDFFVVAEDPLELREISPRPDVLKWCAQASQGTQLTSTDSWDSLKRIQPKVMRVNRRKDVPVWSGLWILCLAILLPSLEWGLRRRWGLT
jgi:hypothetical protein